MQNQTTVQDLEKILKCPVNQWHTLQSIHLYNSSINYLPPEVGQWTAAQTINLNSNQLQTLPPEVGQWTAAQYINLSSNQLQTLPPEVGQWTTAQRIYLYSNQLQTLPPSNILKVCNGINYEKLVKDIQLREKKYKSENNDLKKEIKLLKDENLHLRYAYGGSGFQEAMTDFENQIVKN